MFSYRAGMHTLCDRPDQVEETRALRLVVEGTVSETGAEFFRALVRNLASVMGTAGAWVTEYLPEVRRLRTHAFWMNGEFVDHYDHPINGTPCQVVIEGKQLAHFPDRIIELFPEASEIREQNLMSYLGVPLFDIDATLMGHLAVLDTKPLPPEPRLLSLFQVFAARAAAEKRRLRAEQQLREREEELSAVVRSAMDAIVVLDGDMVITRVNPAAERLFGCSDEDLIGEGLSDFLAPESQKRFALFLSGGATGECPGVNRQWWIPENLTVSRWDRSTFPAEATLSGFDNRGKLYHTLILRNIDERVEAERRIAALTAETEFLKEEIRSMQGMGEILGRSPALRQVLAEVQQVAPTDAVVLMEGETGTGKELFARAVHAASRRHKAPLVTVNCAAIPASLMESEFFGHEKGAFTGAVSRRQGRFKLADGGTLFLDEIGELPLDVQGKLLRVLQEGSYEPVGSSSGENVDVRIIAATNRNLSEEVKAGRFREDLYYRLHVFPLRLPPLRERVEDIPVLAREFIRRFAQRMGRTPATLSPDDIRRLQTYAWPGNVRELENVMERAVITAQGGRLDLKRALAPVDDDQAARGSGEATESAREGGVLTVEEMEEFERRNLLRALQVAGWRVSGVQGAAERLGMKPSTLHSRMKALGLRRPS